MERFGAIPSGTALASYLIFIEVVSLRSATPFKGGKVDDAIAYRYRKIIRKVVFKSASTS